MANEGCGMNGMGGCVGDSGGGGGDGRSGSLLQKRMVVVGVRGSRVHLNENFWGTEGREGNGIEEIGGKGKGNKNKKTEKEQEQESQKARTDLERRLQIGRYVGIGNGGVWSGGRTVQKKKNMT